MRIKNLFLAVMTLFAFSACTFIPEPPYQFPNGGESGGTNTEEDVYINETFATSFGVFTPVETVGNYPWIIDYKTAKATSYVDSNGDGQNDNNAAASWIISNPVDFTNETEAYATFEYIIRYSESGKVAANHQLLVSSDYSGDAAKATWVDMPYGAKEGADWSTFYKAAANVPAEFMGKSGIVFALRYTATTKAGTWEVKNFKVAHGTAESAEPEEPAETAEYTVSQALEAFASGKTGPAVIKGYIVGTVDGQVYESGCVFSQTATSMTNLLLADDAEETDHTNCIPVQLPSGAVRSALNLVENPGNYKKFVTLTGSLEKYFGVAGLKSVTKYVIEGAETPEEPATGTTLFSESFSTSLGNFTTQQTLGNFAWKFEEYNGKGYAKVSGYDGTSQDAESWLISPVISFKGVNSAYISFDYVINKGDASLAATNHKVVVTDNFTGDAATTAWTEVPFGAYNDNTWGFKSTGNIALPSSIMDKENVVIAFKYNSTTANSSTWEMNNLVVAAGEGETPEQPGGSEPDEPDTPDTPVIPTEGNILENSSFEDWNDNTPIGWGKDGSNATAHSATISQSTEAYSGNYAVIVNGYSGGNKRLASKSYTLPAGTYTIAAYIKQSGSTAGAFRLGYGIIKDGAIGNSDYKYLNDPTTVTSDWQLCTAEFTLAEETTITALVMNSKVGNGASILVDDVTITAK